MNLLGEIVEAICSEHLAKLELAVTVQTGTSPELYTSCGDQASLARTATVPAAYIAKLPVLSRACARMKV